MNGLSCEAEILWTLSVIKLAKVKRRPTQGRCQLIVSSTDDDRLQVLPCLPHSASSVHLCILWNEDDLTTLAIDNGNAMAKFQSPEFGTKFQRKENWRYPNLVLMWCRTSRVKRRAYAKKGLISLTERTGGRHSQILQTQGHS